MCNDLYSLGKVSTASTSHLRWPGMRCSTVPVRQKRGTKKLLESMRPIHGVRVKEKLSSIPDAEFD